ncbi:MAG: polyprenyl synthetase family protein [Chlorobi bacterium]|nr:polyprenyl synthetase family protein [Chlorobiota bacterium]MBX7217577.1 polyprenyl synthetase family protein [Candidatus Kapabacteria bacterium]
MDLSTISRPIEPHLKEFRKFFRESMNSKMLLLDTVVRYILRQKGKQVRPILVLLSAEVAGGTTRRAYVGATMVELLHTATLVHDDVVDEADERRGFPSINAVWKNKVAVLVGDYLLSRGLLVAVENKEYEFLGVTSEAVRRMSEGELLQIQKSRKLDIKEEEYFKIISDKTASLISTCCELGARSATDDPAAHHALRTYGEMVGIAFQIRDDIFDYVSTDAAIGKPTGNDLKEKKLTLPLIYSMNNAPRKEAKKILSLIKNGEESRARTETVRQFVTQYGGLVYAERTAVEYCERARASIANFRDSEAKRSLLAFVEFALTRSA